MLRSILARGALAIEKLEMATARVNVAIVLAMMLIVTFEVVMRYIAHNPIDWAIETTEYMMVALSFIAIAYVQHGRQHITVQFLIVRQSERTKVIFGIIGFLFSLGLFVLITWASWEFALKALRFGLKSEEAGFPLFPSRILVPIGSAIMCLQLLVDLVRGINWLASRKKN